MRYTLLAASLIFGACGGALTAPTTPLPEDGASNASSERFLEWGEVSQAVLYRVYFSAEEASIEQGEGLYGIAIRPRIPMPPLNSAEHYYWRVEAQDIDGFLSSSETWSFSP